MSDEKEESKNVATTGDENWDKYAEFEFIARGFGGWGKGTDPKDPRKVSRKKGGYEEARKRFFSRDGD